MQLQIKLSVMFKDGRHKYFWHCINLSPIRACTHTNILNISLMEWSARAPVHVAHIFYQVPPNNFMVKSKIITFIIYGINSILISLPSVHSAHLHSLSLSRRMDDNFCSLKINVCCSYRLCIFLLGDTQQFIRISGSTFFCVPSFDVVLFLS